MDPLQNQMEQESIIPMNNFLYIFIQVRHQELIDIQEQAEKILQNIENQIEKCKQKSTHYGGSKKLINNFTIEDQPESSFLNLYSSTNQNANNFNKIIENSISQLTKFKQIKEINYLLDKNQSNEINQFEYPRQLQIKQHPDLFQENKATSPTINDQQIEEETFGQLQFIHPKSLKTQTRNTYRPISTLHQQQQQKIYKGNIKEDAINQKQIEKQPQSVKQPHSQTQQQLSKIPKSPKQQQQQQQLKVQSKQQQPQQQDQQQQLNSLLDQQLTMNTFKLESILGQGAYATVRLALQKKSKQKYAIKIYEKSRLNSDQSRLNNIKREIQVLKKLDNDFVIKLHSAFQDSRSINLVMEYHQATSLASHAKSKVNRQLSCTQALKIFSQLAHAVQYLHNNQIAHRDIKLENILLLKETNSIKLIDFGFSLFISPHQRSNIFCGTPNYISPEIASKTSHPPMSSDIWAMGIVLYLLLTGQYPFKGANDRELYRQIQVAKWKLPEKFTIDASIKSPLSEMLAGCLEKDYRKRWTAEQILSSSILNGYGMEE